MAYNLKSDEKWMEDYLVTNWKRVVSSVIAEFCNKSRKWTEGYYHEEIKN
jgi:hypothetical protein